MKRIIEFVRSKEWALVVSVVTALLSQLPALMELLEGELDRGDWSPTGLLIIIAGWVIRSNVWQKAKVDQLATTGAETLLSAHRMSAELAAQRQRDLEATIILERARQGLPVTGVDLSQQQAQPPEVP